MHLSMYKNPIILRNIEKLKEIGVIFVEPEIRENKAKLPNVGKIINKVKEIWK